MAIQSFARRVVEDFFYDGRMPRREGWKSIASVVQRKLDILEYAHVLADLRSPPGKRLEALKGNLSGFYSIRINQQWRILFRWDGRGPSDVDVVDYHD